mmetsp:Transcript_22894/g.37676  ORF Transcript_22894/g.37676 Transcript_22894/m.37676 type:complete len:83 (+) Transcript_22894:146-394(+)|eukprot:CAMPEP_0184645692 /NCGR_PEP_ID=MMETSP0308-20130426/2244_1 /TAXON_ID=38269 /ORGANISM="Gloeochaete witrockiana, Strain SAG 46.84" /LENGTH=82 /DNA_ID=CAMNT_0027074979 /DNA_START=98 /DNA_END=346 /DNA_ORIENTATION=-
MFAVAVSASAAPMIPFAKTILGSRKATPAWFENTTVVYMSGKKEEKKEGAPKKKDPAAVGSFDVAPIKRYGPFPPTYTKSMD